jgi:hypothetical protein
MFILDPNFSIPDPGSSVKKIPDPPHQIIKVFLTLKLILGSRKMIWDVPFIPDQKYVN